MFHHGRFSIYPIIFILSLTLTIMFSCSEQPTAFDTESGNDLIGSGTIDPGTGGSFLLGAVSDTSIAAGILEVWAMNVAFDETLGLVTFDAQILNRTSRTIAPPIRFVVKSIVPPDIAAVDFDGISRDGLPFYDFSAKLGNDNLLTPGERTEPVTLKFHTVTARSFAIGFRIEIGPMEGTGIIGGVVYFDANRNGQRDRECRCEPGIPGITVALETELSNGDVVTLLTRTDANGDYRFGGRAAGIHKVFVAPPEDLWKVTSSNPLLVTLVKGADGKVQDFFGAHFGLISLAPPLSTLFGPIIVGPFSPFGAELDSTFVNPPSPLTVVFSYYVEVMEPPYMMPRIGVVDSAAAWINGEMVFWYAQRTPQDSVFFSPQTIKIREGLVKGGENTIRLLTAGGDHTVLMWRVYKKP